MHQNAEGKWEFDDADEARGILARMAEHADEYAGLPLGIDDERLVIHPSYRWASVINGRKKPADPESDAIMDEWEFVNSWGHPHHKSLIVYVLKHRETGRHKAAIGHGSNPLTMQFSTFGIASVWDYKAEAKAVRKLAELAKPAAFIHYMLTGSFLETSKRSGVTYMFRRLRPTLAIKADDKAARCLAALCLHPIGYYDQTWAGCMVPTDEVVAHLMLMRGDEADFWRQANQHPPHTPQAGL